MLGAPVFRAPLCIALALSFSGATPLEPAAQQEPRRFLHSRAAGTDAEGFYHQPAGLCEDYPEETTTSEKIQRDFAVLRETGSKLLRFGIGWDGIEEAPGDYNWRFWDEIIATAEREGVTLLPYLCYTPQWLASEPEEFWRQPPRDPSRFGHFVETIVTRFRGRIHSWELWNEPDNRDYWRGSARQFAAMSKSGAAAVRRADPQAVVVLGGLAGAPGDNFARALFQRHQIGRSIDVLNLHSYFETWDNRRAEQLPRRITGYKNASQAMATKRGAAPDLWLAEFGYSSAAPVQGKVSAWVKAAHDFEHTREFQAVALLRHHVLALASGQLSLTAWFRIRDLAASESVIGDDNNRHFGLIDVAGQPKPALAAMRLWNRLMDQPTRKIAATIVGRKRPKAQVYAFAKKDGAVVVAAWLPVPSAAESKRSSAPAIFSETVDLRVAAPAGSQLTSYATNGEVRRNAPSFQDDIIAGVKLLPASVFIAELKPARNEERAVCLDNAGARVKIPSH
jgi:hypothetical protein